MTSGSSSGGPLTGELCSNTCSAARNGICEDGGPGAVSNVCNPTNDCADCGPRTSSDFPGYNGNGPYTPGGTTFVMSYPPPPPSGPVYTDAVLGAQLLGSSGDLYLTVTSGGTGYTDSDTLVLNSTAIALNLATAPTLSFVHASNAITSLLIPCQDSEVTSIVPRGCARANNYGRLGEFEYTQGSLVRALAHLPPPGAHSFRLPNALIHILTVRLPNDADVLDHVRIFD